MNKDSNDFYTRHDSHVQKKDGEVSVELVFKNALHKFHGTLLFTCGTQMSVSAEGVSNGVKKGVAKGVTIGVVLSNLT